MAINKRVSAIAAAAALVTAATIAPGHAASTTGERTGYVSTNAPTLQDRGTRAAAPAEAVQLAWGFGGVGPLRSGR
ncbi:MAG: hypothetical protein ACREU4_13390 [Burkholderiales bacterium]